MCLDANISPFFIYLLKINEERHGGLGNVGTEILRLLPVDCGHRDLGPQQAGVLAMSWCGWSFHYCPDFVELSAVIGT